MMPPVTSSSASGARATGVAAAGGAAHVTGATPAPGGDVPRCRVSPAVGGADGGEVELLGEDMGGWPAREVRGCVGRRPRVRDASPRRPVAATPFVWIPRCCRYLPGGP